MDYTHEIIIPDEKLQFKVFLFEGCHGNYVRRKHCHSCVEILLVMEGGLKVSIDNMCYELGSGQFIIINSNERHAIYAPEENTTMILQIPVTIFGKYSNHKECIVFRQAPVKEDEETVRMLKEIYNTYNAAQDDNMYFKVMGWFYMFLYNLVGRYTGNTGNSVKWSRGAGERRLPDITEYMKDNFRNKITLEETAQAFGYSSAYLSRSFKKYLKVNFKDYLQNIRVENACRDLCDSDKTIGEIALCNGFANSKSFAKAFKIKYGVLPSVYKRTKNCYE